MTPAQAASVARYVAGPRRQHQRAGGGGTRRPQGGVSMTLAAFLTQMLCWTVIIAGCEAIAACIAGGKADDAAARWSR